MNSYELNEANQKLLLEAYEFHKQNNFPQSIEQFDKILKTEKDYIIISYICFFKARALRELNRQDDALNCIEEGLRHNASSSFLLYLKAKIITWGDYSSLPLDQSIKIYQSAGRFSEQAQINFKESNQTLKHITNKIPDEDLGDFVPTINDMRFLESHIRTMLGPLLVFKNTKDGFDLVAKDINTIQSTFLLKAETIEKQVAAERTRTIELLGLFTAIFAFIFSGIQIATKLAISEALIVVTGIGLILLCFLLALHIVLQSEKRWPSVVLLIFLLLTLVFLTLYAPKLSTHITDMQSSNKASNATVTESEPVDKAPAKTDKASKPETTRTK